MYLGHKSLMLRHIFHLRISVSLALDGALGLLWAWQQLAHSCHCCQAQTWLQLFMFSHFIDLHALSALHVLGLVVVEML